MNLFYSTVCLPCGSYLCFYKFEGFLTMKVATIIIPMNLSIIIILLSKFNNNIIIKVQHDNKPVNQ